MRILILVLLLAGCATQAKYEKILKTWPGQNTSYLIEKWGIPTKTFNMSDGRKALEYTYDPGVQSTLTYNPYTGYQTHNNHAWCKTTFIANEKDIIERWSIQGTNCIAN